MLMCRCVRQRERQSCGGAAGGSPELRLHRTHNELLMGCWEVKWGTGAGLEEGVLSCVRDVGLMC